MTSIFCKIILFLGIFFLPVYLNAYSVKDFYREISLDEYGIIGFQSNSQKDELINYESVSGKYLSIVSPDNHIKLQLSLITLNNQEYGFLYYQNDEVVKSDWNIKCFTITNESLIHKDKTFDFDSYQSVQAQVSGNDEMSSLMMNSELILELPDGGDRIIVTLSPQKGSPILGYFLMGADSNFHFKRENWPASVRILRKQVPYEEFDGVMTSQRQLSSMQISNIQASSTLSPNYTKANLMDNNPKTAWIEGEKGYGEGSTLNFIVRDAPVAFSITPGYQKTSELYYRNGRPMTIRIVYNSEEYGSLIDSEVRLPTNDKGSVWPGTLYIYFNNGLFLQNMAMTELESITVSIVEVDKSFSYDPDTAISEMHFYK